MACAALRLARFNVQIDTADKRYFTGLPSPSAAAVVAGMVWAGTEHGVSGESIAMLAAMLTLFVGVMMVSSLKFNSFKEIDFRGRVPFFTIFIVVLALAIISTDPSRVLLVMFLLYALSGPAAYLWQGRKRPRGI
jgi:CDP-diacylglycerol--serine O-phosphatidyltransferase